MEGIRFGLIGLLVSAEKSVMPPSALWVGIV
jgi:hypothetical protein